MDAGANAGETRASRERILWGDPLWSALERAIRALEDNPRILVEKTPDWDAGLNATEVNRLASRERIGNGRVFEQLEHKDGDIVERRVLRVYHPVAPVPTEVETWHRYSPRPISPAALERVRSYLRAWQSERAEQVLGRARPPEEVSAAAAGALKTSEGGGAATKIHEPANDEFAAYWLHKVAGKKQAAVASEMSKQLGRQVKQHHISRWCAKVRKFLEAGGREPDWSKYQPDARRVRLTDPRQLDRRRSADSTIRTDDDAEADSYAG